MRAQEFVTEEWSAKYKRSINCSNPKGFSQKAHCAGRKKNEDLTEFAPASNPGGGNYLLALASAWYNGTFDSGSLQKGIKSQEDVEKILARGIHCGDGKVRKYSIGYNAGFDGVEIQSDDYYEHADYDDAGRDIDSRTGQPWGPYDVVEFSDSDLSEGAEPGMAEGKKKRKKQSSKSMRGYFFPGYAYYGSGDSGDGGGDGGGESMNRGMAEASDDTVVFEIDSEDAYNAVLDKFGQVIEWDNDYMVAPRRYWGAIQELAHNRGGAAVEAGQEQLDELSFRGSQCTKDCSGHRAGYEWSLRKGGTDAASRSPSFNKGSWLHNNGF
jgi:hypothetical protein